MTHVAHGDMVTLALLRGVLNTFVIFLARVVGTAIDGAIGGQRDDRVGGGMFYFLTVIILQVVFAVLATVIVMAFSPHREYRADAGGAQRAGRNSMIAALHALERIEPAALPGQFQAFGMADVRTHGLLRRLFMSHPPHPWRAGRGTVPPGDPQWGCSRSPEAVSSL